MTLLRFPRPWAQQQGDVYAINRPLATHWRLATCAEVRCRAYVYGWTTLIDERTQLGQAQATYIRADRTRQCREERRPDGLTAFRFEAGQRPFAGGEHDTHRVPLEIDPLFELLGRGVGITRLQFDRWVNQFNEHFQKAASERR